MLNVGTLNFVFIMNKNCYFFYPKKKNVIFI